MAGMTIGQVTERTGLRASAIRFYEKEGLIPRAVRSGGQRRYGRAVLEQLAVLEFTKRCGFTLAEIRQLLDAFRDQTPLSDRVKIVGRRKIAELDALTRRIAAMRKLLERAEACRCGDIQECGRRILNHFRDDPLSRS